MVRRSGNDFPLAQKSCCQRTGPRIKARSSGATLPVQGASSGILVRNCGALAQLGERLHGMQEVSGSIPLGSTNSLPLS